MTLQDLKDLVASGISTDVSINSDTFKEACKTAIRAYNSREITGASHAYLTNSVWSMWNQA